MERSSNWHKVKVKEGERERESGIECEVASCLKSKAKDLMPLPGLSINQTKNITHNQKQQQSTETTTNCRTCRAK